MCDQGNHQHVDPTRVAGWDVVVPAVPGCNNKCQTVWGWCTLHRTCSCAKAPYAHVHKWAPIDKPKKEGGKGWGKGLMVVYVDHTGVTM